MTFEGAARLARALSDGYRIERELRHSEGARIAHRKGAKGAKKFLGALGAFAVNAVVGLS